MQVALKTRQSPYEQDGGHQRAKYHQWQRMHRHAMVAPFQDNVVDDGSRRHVGMMRHPGIYGMHLNPHALCILLAICSGDISIMMVLFFLHGYTCLWQRTDPLDQG